MTSSIPQEAKKVSASDFKAHCLRLLDEVADTGHELLITKRGQPVARIAPLESRGRRKPPETLKRTVTYHGDVTEPVMDPFSLDEDDAGVWDR